MNRNWKHITAAAVEAIHTEVIAADGGSAGLRDEGLLESAVAAPRATFGGEALMQGGGEIAAAYLFYLCRNHPFVDGNKRTALAACLVFLEINDLLPKRKLPLAAWESLVLDVAGSKLDRAQSTQRLRKLMPRAKA
jgi:death-on-curing protein